MKDYIQSNKKGLILVAIATIIMIGVFVLDSKKMHELKEITLDYSSPMVDAEKVITQEEKIKLTIEEYENEINFLADTFQIERETFINKIKEDYTAINSESNDNFSKALIDYLLSLEKNEKALFDKKRVPCTDNKEYILSLINYFSSIYGNVDYKIAASIAEIESGYAAKGMLNKNNIFGGMANGKLISYKNIEYGVLRYVKLLSEGYFAKGLTTVETIGRVYNPTYNEKGVKIASPSWVRNVNNALKKYEDQQVITDITDVIALHEAV